MLIKGYRIVIATLLFCFCTTPACTSGEDPGLNNTKQDGVSGDVSDMPGPSDIDDALGQEEIQDTNPGPKPGEFGYKCTENKDCDSGWCIQSAQGSICTRKCVQECPEDWVCKQVLAFGADPVFICVPFYLNLCNPCTKNADCSTGTSGDEGAICVDYGEEGKFCGADCSTRACPDGYECVDVDIDGVKKSQCKPANGGVCECNPRAANLELETSCTVTNNHGTCTGTRKCTLSGLSQCDAKSPEAEKCDGKDNNCDGVDDNLKPDATCPISNQFGTCPGKPTCIQGQLVDCQGVQPQLEVCDGVDNNCDGKKDEGFPDTDLDGLADCIDPDDDNDGVLDEDDNCPKVKNPPDDQTQKQPDLDGDGIGDACDPDQDGDGVEGGPGPNQDCDDRDNSVSPTKPEICDGKDNDCDGVADNGLCVSKGPCEPSKCEPTPNDPQPYKCVATKLPPGAPCDDKSECTTLDQCQSDGSCVGTPKNCDDQNDCTKDTCDTKNGNCINTPFNGGSCAWPNVQNKDLCFHGTCSSTNGGECVKGNPVNCPDAPPGTKTEDIVCWKKLTCDSSLGCQWGPLTGTDCSDDELCTGGTGATRQDVCANGQCIGGSSPCSADTNCPPCGLGLSLGGICTTPFDIIVCIGGCICL